VSDRAANVRCTGAAMLAALLMRAVADLELPAQWLSLMFVPALLAPLGARVSTWALSGAAFGAVYTGSVLLGLAKWGLIASSLFWAGLTGLFVMVWMLSGVVAARVSSGCEPLVLPLVWGLSSYSLDEWLYGALLLSAPSAPHSAWLRGLAASIGCPLTDALVLLCAAGLAIALRPGGASQRATGGVLAVLVMAMQCEPVGATAERSQFLVVQPAIHWRRLAATGWSLEVRMEVEAQLDRLSREAASRGPGTILWPENGNGLANHLLQRRTRALAGLLTDEHDLLAGGPDYGPSGQAQALLHLERAGHRATAHKVHLVPWIERDLSPGVPTVLATRAGPVGVAVCYDIMFGRHARALAAAGAESIAVTTDDASFGASTLARWHWGYAVFHAAEVGRSLVYASNSGPSGAMDAVRGDVGLLLPAGVAATAAVQVSRSTATSPAVRGGRHLAALIAALVLVGLLRRRRPRVRRSGPTLLVWLGLPLAAAALETGYMPLALGMEAARWREDVRQRLTPTAAADFLGPLFRQTGERSCGAATLAFALTLLGDLVFEDELLRALEAPADEISFAQLDTLARARGFTTEALAAKDLAMLQLAAGEVAIVHLERHHYVAVWAPRGNRVALFDSSHGAVFDVAVAPIEAAWTGRVLIVRHDGVSARTP
jgi:apolipoprotein N-acyltransferase/predicted double-glycine peptidase